MLLRARSPKLVSQALEVELYREPGLPGLFVRTSAGLCLTLAAALEIYEIWKKSEAEALLLAMDPQGK